MDGVKSVVISDEVKAGGFYSFLSGVFSSTSVTHKLLIFRLVILSTTSLLFKSLIVIVIDFAIDFLMVTPL